MRSRQSKGGTSNSMVILAVAALAAGIICGYTGLGESVTAQLVQNRELILGCLMFLVGISIGMHRGLFRKIREYHVRILIIPGGIIVGSIAGGIVCAWLTGFSLNQSTAAASALGWYSLGGVMLENLAGAQMGSITFLSCLMREIFSFFMIPWIAGHLNYYSCIAPAGATSEDTTLPMMIRYTNEETVVLSVLNGVICSAMVPVLISFCFQFF